MWIYKYFQYFLQGPDVSVIVENLNVLHKQDTSCFLIRRQMQWVRGVWAVITICRRHIYKIFTLFWQLKRSELLYGAKMRYVQFFFAGLHKKEVQPCIILLHLQPISLSTEEKAHCTDKTGQDTVCPGNVSGFSLAVFGVSQSLASSACVLFVHGSLQTLQPRNLFPGRWRSSSALSWQWGWGRVSIQCALLQIIKSHYFQTADISGKIWSLLAFSSASAGSSFDPIIF